MKNFCAVVILTLISVLPAYAGKWSTGTTAPATCAVGDSWTDTNGTADNRFYTCTATNTWTLNSNQTAIDTKANKAGSVMLWSEYGGGASFDTTSPQVSYNGAFYKCINPYVKTLGEYPDTQTGYFEEVTGGGGISHATSDGGYYASKDGSWSSLDGVFVSRSTENDWTAVQNFGAGFTASGMAITLGSLSDVKFGSDNWVDDTKTSGNLNYLWSSKMVFDQLALKSDTTHNHTGVYEPADANIIKVSEVDSLAEFEALLGWSPGSGGSFSFDTFPTYEDSAHTSGIAVNGTTLAVYSATASKWLTVGLTDSLSATPATYSLTITPVGFTGADKFTHNSTDYTTEQVFTGLSADASFTVTPDTGRTITCDGTGLTDNTGGSYTANTDTANVVATCTSVASTSYTFNSTMDSLAAITSPLVGTGGTTTGDETYTAGVTGTAFTKNAATTSGFTIPSSNIPTSSFTMEFDIIPSFASSSETEFRVSSIAYGDVYQELRIGGYREADSTKWSWYVTLKDDTGYNNTVASVLSTDMAFASGQEIHLKIILDKSAGTLAIVKDGVEIATYSKGSPITLTGWGASDSVWFKYGTHTSKLDNLMVQ